MYLVHQFEYQLDLRTLVMFHSGGQYKIALYSNSNFSISTKVIMMNNFENLSNSIKYINQMPFKFSTNFLFNNHVLF